jgi:hypothetical protein
MLDDLSGGREAPRGAAAHPAQGICIWPVGCGKLFLEIRDRGLAAGRGCSVGGRGRCPLNLIGLDYWVSGKGFCRA